ncbi:MAG: hypothetical protein C0502_01930, partial [Opitutus sp.]|nr:hypothetical protein [Opitutus sp.]
APAAATPLEFRGTFTDSGERFFSILDTASRRAEWVGLNEPGRPFTVKSYNAEKESIVLELQGRPMELKLHAARVASAPMPMPAVAQTGPAAQPPRPAVAQPTTTEAQRLAQVAEEIRRRRALRQQAQQQQGGTVPNAAPPPANQPRNN